MTTLTHPLKIPADEMWKCFIGQEAVKRQLRVAAASARERGESMSHVLLASGEPGIGKTTLAHLIAQELNANLKEMSGKVSVNEARIALSDLADLDVLLVDEVHRLGQPGFDWLMHLLTDGVLMGPMGPEPQADITVVGTTTDLGRLPRPLISRFPLQPHLADYTDEEAAQIAHLMSSSIFTNMPPLEDDDARVIARAANNNPRTIRSILENLRDIYLFDPSIYDGAFYDLTEALDWLGLSVDGLTVKAREYLRLLYQEFGGQAGEKPLAERLNEPGGLHHIEAVLTKRGYINRGARGRVLTRTGIKRAKEELA